MIVWINSECVDAKGRDQRIIRLYAPGRRATTAISCLPDTASHAGCIGDDASIRRGCGINYDGIDTTGSCCVVKASGTTGHFLGFRTE